MIESGGVFRRRRFRRAKAHLLLSALRHRAAYRHVRRDHGLLMDGEQPADGTWNLDTDNRESNALGHHAPPPDWFAHLEADAVQARYPSTTLAQVRDRRLGPSHTPADDLGQPRSFPAAPTSTA